MSHRTSRRFRFRLAPRALALALVVLALPIAGSAIAKGPIYQLEASTGSSETQCVPPARNMPPPLIQPGRVLCDDYAAQAQSTGGSSGIDAGIVAGGAALLGVITVGAIVVAIRRRAPQPTRPAAQH